MQFTFRITQGATYWEAEVYAPLANGQEHHAVGGRFFTKRQATQWAQWQASIANQPV